MIQDYLKSNQNRKIFILVSQERLRDTKAAFSGYNNVTIMPYQTDHLDELIRQIVKLLLAEEKREDIEFKIEFNSLRTMSDLEMAEYEKLKSETLKNKIDTIINLSRQVEGIEISADEFKNIRDELLRDIKADLGE